MLRNRKISDRRLDDLDALTLFDLMNQLVQDEDLRRVFLSPEPHSGRYVTSETTLNKRIDPRIFRETQLKRLFRWLSTKPPLFRVFFNWLFVQTMGMKLAYFSENEHHNVDRVYKNKQSAEHAIQQRVVDGFKLHNLGHATQLIQTEGLNILTDPIFGNIAPLIYPSMTKKYNGDMTPADLPPIDVILISHNHRDHVDEASLKALIRLGHQPTLLVPKGDGPFFSSLGFTTVQELEWHEEVSVRSQQTGRDVTICCAPSDHRSGRKVGDAHHSLVNGFVISPRSRQEILYFAGDTARLDDTRMLSLALDVYALCHNKDIGGAPQIINLSPGGPNYTRKDMLPTHQSAVDSIASAFRLAVQLAVVSRQDNSNISADQWLEMTATVFMHHNRFELGPDRFNENVFIYNRLCSYLRMNDTDFQAQCAKQAAKSAKWSLFHRRKDFITNGVIELRALAEQIWPDRTPEERNQKLLNFIQARTHFPMINEKVGTEQLYSFADGATSTIKPETNRGVTPKRPSN